MKSRIIKSIIIAGVVLVSAATGINLAHNQQSDNKGVFDIEEIEKEVPEYSDKPYYELNNNQPYFLNGEIDDTRNFEYYGELDELGRCQSAFANICVELMPTEDRGSIGHIKPTGWKQEKYPGVVNSEPPYLYNRCHLIGFQLAGENANERNLITGTRYFNVEGMLPFEKLVADYVKDTENHVLYRVTPVYEGNNLVAKGVIMEGYSVEDKGGGVCFCVFVYNVQPGVKIDYTDGSNMLADY